MKKRNLTTTLAVTSVNPYYVHLVKNLFSSFVLFLFLCSFQDPALDRQVMRMHDNGQEHVVLYFDKMSKDLMKEEVFFPNGNLQWTGTYKSGKEDGTWQFFYSNGNIKTVENYEGGKEHGVTTHFNEQGKKTKEEFWKHGKKIKELKY
jgi:antitoxin component YwqK of YwqJK toxin-antitoxin module